MKAILQGSNCHEKWEIRELDGDEKVWGILLLEGTTSPINSALLFTALWASSGGTF